MKLSTILLTILIVAGGFAANRYMSELATEPPEVKKVEPEVSVAVLSAEITSYRPRISLIGQIEAKDEAVITSPLETEVLQVNFEEGDFVSRGQPLLALDVRDTEFQLEAQIASIDDINAQIESLDRDLVTENRRLEEIRKLQELAKEELERNKQLLERGVVAQTAVDRSLTTFSSRELEVIGQLQKIDTQETSRKRLNASKRATEARIGQLRLVLERARLEAPFSGIVKVMNPSAGTRVNRGSVLTQLYDPQSLRLRAAIPNEYSNDAVNGILEAEFRVNNSVVVSQLSSVSPEVKSGRGGVDALFNLPNADWLLGASIEFDLLLPQENQTVAVPFDAIYSGSRVYVVGEENRAKAIECFNMGQTVIRGQSLALITCNDLNNGDQIVVNRIPNLVSGTKLKVQTT